MRLNTQSIRARLAQRRSQAVERALREQGWYAPDARSPVEAVFVGGCGRSGTSLFKEVLNRHPRLACGPETSLFGLPFNTANIADMWGIPDQELKQLQAESPNLVHFAESFSNRFLQEEGKARWVEKTPNNIRAIGSLLTWFPNARFVHVIRDGRDVVCSLRHHPNKKIVNGQIVPVQRNNPVEKTARRWLEDTSAGLAYRSHPRVLEVRYESLVADPAAEFGRVCAFIGEAYSPAMLDPNTPSRTKRPGLNLNNPSAGAQISAKSVGRWRSDLTATERRAFIDIAGELLVALGYAPDHAWADNPVEARS